MGVTGLWTVLQPCARPIKIETLNKKRLAVDASIWIYQFLKAVRDKEGNALRNSHIVGFFRRICKLLFFGIKPVFVFDGGAPALKRQTISNRKQRREGRREDAVRTAGKLLALQMQRVAEEEEKKRKEARRHPREEPEEEIPDNVIYADEVLQTPQERQQNRKFKKKDAYHLPELDTSLSAMGGQNDPRIMSLEELEEYARQFDRGEDINVYDFSKIDFDSPFFSSLPAADRYNILNAARLRSRLRMGYSKEQLDHMFPDRMAFSKFQIERVRERNELTQRLMNINGMTDDPLFGTNMTSRIAGEKGREYVLVKNDGVEGGWALGVVTSRDEGQMNKPIDVDTLPTGVQAEDEDWESDEEFEDVPIEGLNRLPKPQPGPTAEELEGRNFVAKELAKRRKALYDSKKKTNSPRPRKPKPVNEDPDSLFLAADDDDDEGAWENVNIGGTDELFEESREEERLDEEEEHLQKAIALSLQKDVPSSAKQSTDEDEDEYREVFQQQKVVERSVPFSSARASGLAIARMANQRSSKVATRGPFEASDSDDDEEVKAAIAKARKPKPPAASSRPTPTGQTQPSRALPITKPGSATTNKAPGFDGPLPFEKLNLGSSILGRKKVQKAEDPNAGGFVIDLEKEKYTGPTLPPWYIEDRDRHQQIDAQKEAETREREREKKAAEQEFQYQEITRLRKPDFQEDIGIEASQDQGSQKKDVITIDSSEDGDIEMEDVVMEDPKIRMGDLADKVRAEPPKPLSGGQRSPPRQEVPVPKSPSAHTSDDEPIEWSESEPETQSKPLDKAQKSEQASWRSPSASPEFEDVAIGNEGSTTRTRKSPSLAILEGIEELGTTALPLSGTADDNAPLNLPSDDSDQYSDPEDAELFASLAAEAEEHARFASSLNSTATKINFDEELKQLRAQQKKDRRDADEVTQTMISECQHLLTLFGLPYVTAPMEAEAQCAELVHLGLVDGIVTDDSDTFLFGGTRVYKNMFNTAKFVECYLSSDLESEFALTRDKLISIAQLLGSDYTPGIPGIGPVTALEILSEFGDLASFKDWWTAVQSNPLNTKPPPEPTPWRRRFRRSQATKLYLPPGFPDPRVADAYLHPDVDSDPQGFVWGVPDLDALRTYLSAQIGWSMERTDEVLVPVIRDMNRREKEGTQSNITRFFEGQVGAGAFAPRVVGGDAGRGRAKKGGRLGVALGRLRERDRGGEGVGDWDGDVDAGDGEGGVEELDAVGGGMKAKTTRTKRKKTPTMTKKKKKKMDKDMSSTHDEDTLDETRSVDASDNDIDDDDDDGHIEPRPKKARRGRKGKARL